MALQHLGQIYEEEKQSDKALKFCEKAVRAAKQSSAFDNQLWESRLGLAYYYQGHYGKAKSILRRVARQGEKMTKQGVWLDINAALITYFTFRCSIH